MTGWLEQGVLEDFFVPKPFADSVETALLPFPAAHPWWLPSGALRGLLMGYWVDGGTGE